MGDFTGWLGQGQRHDAFGDSFARRRDVRGRVLSTSNPSVPASMKRCCQRHTQVLAFSVARMISFVPTPWADNSTICARQTCFCGPFRSAAISTRRVWSVSGACNLVLPQFPCCRACTADVNQGETRIHIHGASSRVLDLALLRPAFTQSHTGHSDTRAPNHRGRTAANIGGMPGLPHFFPSCSQPLSARVARSPVAGSSGDSPSRGSPL
jgi:hypothetical protein